LFNDYEGVFVSNIKLLKEQGSDYGIFGDFDLAEHRQWEERVCDRASITAVLPLWQRDRKELVEEIEECGFPDPFI
jgi:diphthine-ammonia ligase